MPAKNKRQQRLFGMALALERGKMPKGKASKKVKAISKGMSEKDIEEFAKTKHKGLKENKILSFTQFINERTHIDREGRLKDLEFTPHEEFEINMFDEINSIKEFLEDAGAKSVKSKIDDGLLKFRFVYRSEPYLIHLNLDTDSSILTRIDPAQEGGESLVVFDGPTDSLFELIKVNGFDFLNEY